LIDINIFSDFIAPLYGANYLQNGFSFVAFIFWLPETSFTIYEADFETLTCLAWKVCNHLTCW